MTTDSRGSSVACEWPGNGLLLTCTDDALSLMGDAMGVDSRKLLLRRDQICPEFFDLSTRIAGDILQKYTNYRMCIAIVGDFSDASEPLRDFIFESNKGGHVFFSPDRQTALDHLHRAGG